jgi:NAD(P)-dependent dehydrogenase (short-subunit alcohol dehydrogenase family)
MICRNRERGEEARRELAEATGNGKLSLRLADLSDLDAVGELGESMASELERLDGLVHNAGALFDERATTERGLERTVALHVVGPHLLTDLLVEPLANARDGRVVWMSSGGMYTQRLDVDELFDPPEPFDGVVQYARAKRAQVVLARLWNRRLEDRGICVNAMHPGWVDTGGVRSSLPTFYTLTRWFLRTPEQGADTAVWLSASPQVERCGAFYFDREPRREHLPGASTRADAAEADRLWQAVEEVR